MKPRNAKASDREALTSSNIEDASIATPSDAALDLLNEVYTHEGFKQMPEWLQRDFVAVVMSSACDPLTRTFVGGWRAISAALKGLSHRAVFNRLSAWRDAGLVSESTGETNEFYPPWGKRRFVPGSWEILPTSVTNDRSEYAGWVRVQRDAHGDAHDARARVRGRSDRKTLDAHGDAHGDAHAPLYSVEGEEQNQRDEVDRSLGGYAPETMISGEQDNNSATTYSEGIPARANDLY
jgi:hypothetical protein